MVARTGEDGVDENGGVGKGTGRLRGRGLAVDGYRDYCQANRLASLIHHHHGTMVRMAMACANARGTPPLADGSLLCRHETMPRYNGSVRCLHMNARRGWVQPEAPMTILCLAWHGVEGDHVRVLHFALLAGTVDVKERRYTPGRATRALTPPPLPHSPQPPSLSFLRLPYHTLHHAVIFFPPSGPSLC